jgi:hypothetical protein
MRATCALALGAGLAACQAVAGLGDFAPDDGATTGSGRGGAGGDSSSSADGGAPGDGGATVASTASSTSTGSTSIATATATSTSTGGGCAVDHVVISEVRTRGPDGGNQDFIELFNPTDATVVLGAEWSVIARGEEADNYAARWAGAPVLTLGPGQHALLANDERVNPLGGAVPDALYDPGVPDGASVVLMRGEEVVDAVCFVCKLEELPGDFECEGQPLTREPGCQTAPDRSIQRRSASGVPGCADTDDSAADLEDVEPSTPTGLSG